MAKRSRGDLAGIVEKPYWREREARVVVDAWKASGEKLCRFAAAHGLRRQRIKRWAGRLTPGPGRRVGFHPVRMLAERRPEIGAGARIEVVLADGRRVRVPGGFVASELARVLAVLEGRSAC
jgi:hypothetical protein